MSTHRPLLALLVMAVALRTACTADERPAAEADRFDITVAATVCPSQDLDERCATVRIPDAEVEIVDSATGDVLWAGATNDVGQVEASLVAAAQVTVVARSSLLAENVELVVAAGNDGGTHLTSMSATRIYLLTPKPEGD